MADSVGLGLLLNILFWTVVVLVAVALGSLAIIDYFPGRERKVRKGTDGSRNGAHGGGSRVETKETGDRYRKAS